MRCPACGAEVRDGSAHCQSCGLALGGQPPIPPSAVPGPGGVTTPLPKSGKAVTALLLGIAGLFICLTAPLAIIFGILGIKQINGRPNEYGGKGAATAGIILGVVGMAGWSVLSLLVAIAVPNFLEAQVRSQVSRTRSDMRSMATAIEAYYVDTNAYPAWASGEKGINAFAGPSSVAYEVQTFRLGGGRGYLMSLTTPIAYITSHFPDTFSPTPGATFRYYSTRNGWILISVGPDRDYDFNPATIYNDRDFDVFMHNVANYTFDPTNGTVSNGDVWRVKQ